MKSRSKLTSRKNPTKVSKKKLFLPMVSQMKKENLMGQGIALTLDDHFQEFYNLGERVDEGHAFGTINNLDDIHEIGTVCKLTVTPQTIHQNKRFLMTLEGQERIKLGRFANEQESVSFFEKCREDKIKELKDRVEGVEKLRLNHQFIETTPESLKA